MIDQNRSSLHHVQLALKHHKLHGSKLPDIQIFNSSTLKHTGQNMRKKKQLYKGANEYAGDFWHCEACGGTWMRHVQTVDARGRISWHNRCTHCGHVSEYLPSPERIAYDAARLRAEAGRIWTDDELEKFWRGIAAELLARCADDMELDDDDSPEDDPAEADSPECALEFDDIKRMAG